MKSRLVRDQWANPARAPEYLKRQLKFKPGQDRTGKSSMLPYYPAGTVYEGEEAVLRCRTGQAEPADDECIEALNMPPEQQREAQVDYAMNDLGIHDKDDRELYRAGVILGYRKVDGTDKLEYLRGPNWDSYQAAKAEAADELEEDL